LVAPARWGETIRAGDRGRFQPPDQAPRHSAGATEVRIRSARDGAGDDDHAYRRRSLSDGVPACPATAGATADPALQGLEETDPAEARAFASGEHQMIEQGAVERLGRRGQPARRPAVGIARPRVPARMVMSEHDPGAAM